MLLSRDSQSELSRLAQRSRPSSRAADPQAERGRRSGVGVRDEDEEEADEKRSQRLGMLKSEARTFVEEPKCAGAQKPLKDKRDTDQASV